MAHRIEYVWLICPKRCTVYVELQDGFGKTPGPIPMDCPYHPGVKLHSMEVQPARG